jgi:DNA mismatch endonuclease (patch repair protein)
MPLVAATRKLTKSEQMARVRRANTAPEVALRHRLWMLGLRYRLHPNLPGRPDIAFPRARVVVFVDGCFWHQCPRHKTMPVTNASFWHSKLSKNRDRDRRTTATLRSLGWTVVRIWEHSVETRPNATARRVAAAVKRASAS